MASVDQVIATAQSQLGTPYVFGGETPGKAFDCSGLIQWVFGQLGVSLPRGATDQMHSPLVTRVSSPQPGDLVFWGDESYAYHVALYLGAGKIIAAPDVGKNVEIEQLWGTPYAYGRVKGVGGPLGSGVSLVASTASTAASTLASLLAPGRDLGLQLAFVVFGVGLAGYGLYRSLSPASRRAITGSGA